jgi:putative flippase GtrA
MGGITDEVLHGLRRIASREPAASPMAEFLRYGAASAIALCVDFAVLVLLTEVAGIHYLASAAIGFSLGILVTYFLSVRWVFASRRLASVPAESAVFLLIGIAGLVINHVAMFGLTESAQLPYTVSKIGSACLVFSFNFVARKTVLFRVSTAPKG